MIENVVKCSLSELFKFPTAPPHVKLSVLNVDSSNFLSEKLTSLRSLEAWYTSLEDKDLVFLAKNPFVRNLDWLSIGWNPGVTYKGVEALCESVRDGRMNLRWLDLTGTNYDATPYLNGEGEVAFWRMPAAAHNLATKFGYQRWMKLNGDEGMKVSRGNYPPSRFG